MKMKKHLAIGLVLLFLSGLSGAADPVAAAEDPPGSEKKLVHVYFADPDQPYLTAEDRVVPVSGDPVDLGRQIMTALLQGPHSRLLRTIPSGTRLNALFVTGDGTGYVDLSEAVTEQHPGGCRSEMLTIYSIVNSLVLNVEQIKTVKILIGGAEAWTLAGHVDIRFPFKAEMLLIR
jgi:spore germination protein GerM